MLLTQKFPLIELSGTPEEIGFNHGKLLRERIHKTIEFYTDVTKNLNEAQRTENEKKILAFASHFKSIIAEIAPKLAAEIEAIAKGAEVNPLWIYAINSRSEIMSNMETGSTECTALYFQETKTLAQNWDWAADLEELVVIMKINLENGVEILQFTEPGMLGKIGFNSHGVGVTLNFLHIAKPLQGLPIHIILRKLLESTSFEQALEFVDNVKTGCAGNIILADKNGNYQDVEFAGDMKYFLDNSNTAIVHTNHFLENKSLNVEVEDLQSSFSRYKTASELINGIELQSINKIKQILADRSNSELPICRKYIQGKTMQDVGTVSTIVMDLQNKEMHFTKGSPLKNGFSIVALK